MPVVQAALPPGTEVELKLPVLPFTLAFSKSTAVPTGFFIDIITAVPAPGAGDTVPVMMIGVAPEYEGWFVWTVTV